MLIREFLSPSQLMAFNGCDYSHWASYVLGLRTRAVEYKPSLGSAVHVGMAASMRKDIASNDFMAAIAVWANEARAKLHEDDSEGPELLDAIETNAKDICYRTLETMWNDGWRSVRWRNKPLVEIPLTTDIPGWLGMIGVIDIVLSNEKEGGTFVTDFKVRENLSIEETPEMSLQMTCYQKILSDHGIETSGSAIFQIRAAVPNPVKMTKGGIPSKSDQITTLEMYDQALRDSKQDPTHPEWADIRQKLADKKWQVINKVYRPASEIKNVWENVIVPQARRLAMARLADVTPSRTGYGSFRCPNCWFKDPCLASLKGADPTPFLASFEPRTIDDLEEVYEVNLAASNA